MKVKTKRKDRATTNARGVSLPLDMEAKALKRCDALELNFSKYVQKLIAVDLERTLLLPPQIAA